MIYADLHVHTNYSDGTWEVEDVLKLAKEKGIKAIAITDHDTINQYMKAKQIGESLGIEVIRGVEMSCYDFDVNKKIHIVGLWLNDEAPHVESLCNKTLQCRDKYHRELINSLKETGYEISYEDAKKYSPYNIVFKMNIFQALREKYPNEMTPQKYRELFASETSLETDLKMGYIDIKEGIQAIRKDGGIAIIAHPCEYKNYDEIEKYVGYGLQGIEIDHPGMKEEDYPKTKEFSLKYHLFESGGSDFHDERITKMGNNGLTKSQFEALKKEAMTFKRTCKVRNFRDLRGYKNKYNEVIKKNMIFRGASLDEISEEDVEYLENELNIRYILDYRSQGEANQKPNATFKKAQNIRVGALNLGNVDKNSFDFQQLIAGKTTKEEMKALYKFLQDGYRIMPFNNEAYHRLFEVLLKGEGSIYFHCSAGKDRTGISAFLIMLALGMSEEDCIHEYMLSNYYIQMFNESIMSRVNATEEIKKYCSTLLYVVKESIVASIDAIKDKYSSYDEFLLKEYNIDEEKKAILRKFYCEEYSDVIG